MGKINLKIKRDGQSRNGNLPCKLWKCIAVYSRGGGPEPINRI
jgi:hypothetical protein